MSVLKIPRGARVKNKLRFWESKNSDNPLKRLVSQKLKNGFLSVSKFLIRR